MRLHQADTDPRDVPGIPNVAAAVAAAETQAVALMGDAARQEVDRIKGATRDRTGNLDRSVGLRVRRIPGGGVSVTYGAIKRVEFDTRKGAAGTSKQVAFYADFLDRGTGIHGPKGRRIERKGLIRIGRTVQAPSGEGQRPQRMFTESAERFDVAAVALNPRIDGILTLEIQRRS